MAKGHSVGCLVALQGDSDSHGAGLGTHSGLEQSSVYAHSFSTQSRIQVSYSLAVTEQTSVSPASHASHPSTERNVRWNGRPGQNTARSSPPCNSKYHSQNAVA